jgi:hypothetical protein
MIPEESREDENKEEKENTSLKDAGFKFPGERERRNQTLIPI